MSGAPGGRGKGQARMGQRGQLQLGAGPAGASRASAAAAEGSSSLLAFAAVRLTLPCLLNPPSPLYFSYIIDGSTDPDAVAFLEQAQCQLGVHVFRSAANLSELAELMTRLLKSLTMAADFLLKLDTGAAGGGPGWAGAAGGARRCRP